MTKKKNTIILNRTDKGIAESLFNAVILCMLSTGLLYAFLPCISADNLFGVIPIRFAYFLPFVSVAVYAFLYGLQRLKSRFHFFITIAVALAVMAVLLNPFAIYRGCLGTISRGIELWNIKYEDAVNGFNVQYSFMDLQRFMICLDILLNIILYFFIKRNRRITLGGLLLAIESAALLLGCDVTISAFLVFFCWLCFWCRYISGVFCKRNLVWIVCCGVLCVFVYREAGDIVSYRLDELRDDIKHTYNKVKYGEDLLPQGDMSLAYKLHSDDKNRLQILTSVKKSMYLKGYVGEVYKDGKWDKLPRSAFRDKYSGLFGWLDDKGFSPEMQYNKYIGLSEENFAYHSIDIGVKNLGANRKYIYAPYSLQKLNETGVSYNFGKQITSQKPFGSIKYSFSEQSSDLPAEQLDNEQWVTYPENNEQKSFLDTEKIYRSFVYDNYLSVPEDYKELVDELFWKNNEFQNTDTNVYQATEHIRQVLMDKLTYNDEPKKSPEGSDPIKWYVESYKQANAPVYASLAVLAYREKGIPARYAEGYFVDEQLQFRENWGSAVSLSSLDGHAWCEVYFDGMGWLPIEVTDGYFYDIYNLENTVAMPNNAPSGDENRNSKVIDKSENARIKKEHIEKIKATVIAFVGVAAVIIYAAAFIILCLESYRFALNAYYRKQYSKKNPKERTMLVFKLIVRALKTMHISAKMGKDSEVTADLIHSRIDSIAPREYLRVYQLVEKVYYGGIELQEYEQRTVEIFHKKLVGSKNGLKSRERIVMRYTQPFL